jgi:uncharacterized protein
MRATGSWAGGGGNRLRWLLPLAAALLFLRSAAAAEVIPPAPKYYFEDYAHVTTDATAERLNQELEDFEKATSSQIIAVVYPTMQSDSSIEDYAVRVARAWQAGQKDKNNGAVLFVFVEDHKMYIATGYGLEGALPDAICKRIIDEQITPRFKSGDYDGGLIAGVEAMMAAAKGEYKGTGQTVNQGRQNRSSGEWALVGFIILIIVFRLVSARRSFWGGWMIGSSGFGGWSGGGGGGWSGGGGGGGGFSGGGGSFGGGGAGGSW